MNEAAAAQMVMKDFQMAVKSKYRELGNLRTQIQAIEDKKDSSSNDESDILRSKIA